MAEKKFRVIKGEGDSEMSGPMKMLPHIYIDESDLPEVASWEVDKKYIIAIEVEMVGKRREEYGDEEIEGTLKITKVMALDDLTQEQFEKVIAKAKSS